MSAMKDGAKKLGKMMAFGKKEKRKGPHPDHKEKLPLELCLGPHHIRLPGANEIKLDPMPPQIA